TPGSGKATASTPAAPIPEAAPQPGANGRAVAANEAPPPATLEIRGVEPETRIKLDGVLLGNAAGRPTLSKELPAGEHSIQISRNGFLTRTLTRNLAPGQAVLLTGRDLKLESSDALAAMLRPS